MGGPPVPRLAVRQFRVLLFHELLQGDYSGSFAGSFAANQCAVVSVDHDRRAVVIDPGFLGLLGLRPA